MNKILIATIVILVVLIGGLYLLARSLESEMVVSDPLNTTYFIDGESFTLVNGSIEKEIVPGSATKNKVSVFGEPALGDIDGDGDDDAVLILVNDPGGSGTFYYAAIAANIDGEYKGTDTILLGDRIAPQTFYIEGGRAKVNYADRAPGEDFSVKPSIGKSIHLQFNPENLKLIEVAINPESETGPNTMTLDMRTWKWTKTVYNNDTELVPKNANAFTLTFEDGKFSATTDCNSMSGAYEVDGNQITFKDVAATVMFCEGSQEREFSSMLSEVQSFLFTSRGELILELKFDTGSAIFR